MSSLPGGFPPPPGFPPFGGVAVHQARLGPRLLLVAVIMGLSTLVTAAIVWFAVVGTGQTMDLGAPGRGTRSVERGAQAEVVDDEVDLPATWPAALAPPSDAEVVTAVTSSAGTPDEQVVLVVEVADEAPAVASALRGQLTAAGLTPTSDALGADGTGSIAATGAGWDATVSVTPIPARPGTTTVSWVLRPGPR